MMIALIVYYIVSAILMAYIAIPDKTAGNIGEKIVLDVFCILISPIIVAIAVIQAIGEETIYRKKTKETQLKYYETFSKSTQKKLTNCMKRYFKYFRRT